MLSIRPLLPFLGTALLLGLIALSETACHREASPTNCYPDSVQAILSQHCLSSGCHNTADAAGGLRLTCLNEAMQGAANGAAIIPFSAAQSPLFQYVNYLEDLGGGTLPAGHPQVSRQEVLALQHWIDGGGLDPQGNAYWLDETRTDGKLFVACAAGDNIAVVDSATGLTMHYVAVGNVSGPAGSASPRFLARDDQHLYISLGMTGVIERRRADTYALDGSLSLGSNSEPSVIRLSADGRRAVVALFGAMNEEKLVLFDPQTMQVLDALSGAGICAQPYGLVVNAGFSGGWATAWGGNYLTRFDLAPDSNAFSGYQRICIAPGNASVAQDNGTLEPYWIEYDQSQARLFVTCSNTDELLVLDAQTGAVQTRLATGKSPMQLMEDPTHSRLYVVCRNAQDPAQPNAPEGCVSVYTLLPQPALVQHVYGVGKSPRSLLLDSGRNRLLVAATSEADPRVTHDSAPLLLPGLLHVIGLNPLAVLPQETRQTGYFPAALLR